MKKTLFALTVFLISSAAFAFNPKIISVSHTMYPGGSIDHYADAEQFLLHKARTFCTRQFRTEVEKISNVTIQIQGEFLPTADYEQTNASTYPQVVYTALVTCKVGL